VPCYAAADIGVGVKFDSTGWQCKSIPKPRLLISGIVVLRADRMQILLHHF
jgi:hypothetical protein